MAPEWDAELLARILSFAGDTPAIASCSCWKEKLYAALQLEPCIRFRRRLHEMRGEIHFTHCAIRRIADDFEENATYNFIFKSTRSYAMHWTQTCGARSLESASHFGQWHMIKDHIVCEIHDPTDFASVFKVHYADGYRFKLPIEDILQGQSDFLQTPDHDGDSAVGEYKLKAPFFPDRSDGASSESSSLPSIGWQRQFACRPDCDLRDEDDGSRTTCSLSTSLPSISWQRQVACSPTDGSEASREPSDVGNRDPKNDLEVMVPQWEWCHKNEREHDSIDYLELSSDDWGVYDEIQNSDIEVGFQAGHSMVEVSVGIRTYQIIFDCQDYSEPGMVQRDYKWGAHCAVRAVRRRLVNPEKRAAGLRTLQAVASERFVDATCAVCMQAFADTPTMPVASLPGCGHHFHTACTQRLADQQSDCPFCRTKVDWKRIDNLKRCQPCPECVGDSAEQITDQQKHKAFPKTEENFNGTEATV